MIKRIFLYFSAFIPMYILIMVKFTFGLISETIDFNLLTFFTLFIYITLIVLGVVGLLWNTLWNKDNAEEIIIIEQQNMTDQHFLGYFSLFVLFALTFELTKLSMFFVSLVIIIFIGIVYINNQMFYINPFLNILGYNFFEITYIKTNNNDNKEYSAKLFYKGLLQSTNKPRLVKLKNANFSFVHKHDNE